MSALLVKGASQKVLLSIGFGFIFLFLIRVSNTMALFLQLSKYPDFHIHSGRLFQQVYTNLTGNIVNT